jgi:signal transduction histidine kinase
MATQEAAHVPAAPAPTWDTFALSVLYGAGLAVAVMDRSGRLSLLSPALQRLLHQPYRPVTAAEFPEAFHLYGQGGNVRLRPEDVPLQRAAGTRSPQTGILCLKVPGLPPRHLMWNAFPLTTDSGEAHGAFAVVTDLTTLVADPASGDLGHDIVETVNHTLRTPLTLVRGYAELLAEQRLDLPPEVQHSLASLLRATKRLDDAVTWVCGMV